MARIVLTLIALWGLASVPARANDLVRVVPLAGEAIEGKLVALSAANVSVDLPSGTQQLAATDLLAVEFPSAESPW